MDVVKEFYREIPILGICLGHQCIGEAFGGTVTYAKALFHGKQSEITHTGTGIFAGITSSVKVARYHSLAEQMDDLPEPPALHGSALLNACRCCRASESLLCGLKMLVSAVLAPGHPAGPCAVKW